MNNKTVTTINTGLTQRTKLQKIVFKGLFGNTNDIKIYDIDTSYDVSILTAPNGCGKTTTFKFINFALMPNEDLFHEIEDIPFDEFICILSNGITITIQRRSMQLPLLKNGPQIITIKHSITNGIKTNSTSIEIRKRGSRTSYTNRTKHSGGTIMDGYTDIELDSFISQTIDNLYVNFNCMIYTNFIEANRLRNTHDSDDNIFNINVRKHNRNKMLHNTSSLNKNDFSDLPYDDFVSAKQSDTDKDYLQSANEETINVISLQIDKYNKKVAAARNILISMYINTPDSQNSLDFVSFRKRWEDYVNELNKLYEIGILDSPDTGIDIPNLEDAFNKKASFLTTYLDAFESTLEPLQTEYQQWKLLVDIFNERNQLTNKKLKITPQGLKVTSNGKEIDLEWLSSGEKNDFIMFFKLIIDGCKNGIILIDEPEISLHIEWQEKYIDYLLQICKLNQIQVIIATHSPNIINGHLELIMEKN